MAAPLGIDVHAHFFPKRFLRAIEEAGAPSGGRIDRASPVGPAIDVKEQEQRQHERPLAAIASPGPPVTAT